MINITASAVTEIRRLKEAQNMKDHFLRVGVQGGGCSGLMYSMKFEAEAGEFDKTFDIDGVPVVIDIKSALYLKGTTLDYSTDLTGGGFKFQNPSASRSCGCGSSFSA